ncbi:hypothetical protein PVAP13_9KG624100 [Panicum virgatum]|uniref:Uncharacterized protein n=1 Tax=Panicum virgatum TaxID=38727 RepID=A0A8T0NZF0_PANVG|nr:hypothetical protein PVAP13_9KG624100 [Panicum virgatum]
MLLPPLLRVGPSAPCLGFALRPRQRPRLPPGRQVGLLRTGARSLRRTSTPPVRDHTHTQSICTEGGPQVPRINGTAAAHLAAVASGVWPVTKYTARQLQVMRYVLPI